MRELKEAILREGEGIGQEIVKVDGFLNHRIDTALSTSMGRVFYEAFREDGVDCIMTVEASGIAPALTTAQAFGNIPVIFAKKGDHRNVGSDVYTAQVYSFTHQKMNTIRVSRKYLREGLRVLIIDDFLANGEAVGVGICVEKGFQPGGAKLRERGVKLVSLAVVDAIDNGRIILRD